MAKWSEQYPSKYLRADDLPVGRELRLTIDYVERQQMPDEGEKPVMFFVGKQKGLILNKTNGDEIAAVLGDEIETWRGKPVVMYRTTTLFAGRRVGAIRLRPAGEPAAPQAARVAPVQRLSPREIEAEVAAAGDDDVPF